MHISCAQGDHKDLQSINRTCKKCHIVPPLISEISICDMAVSGRKQKSRRTVFRKNLFQTARRHGAGRILRLFTFQGESRILKNPPFIVTKTKPAETSRFDRQEQLYKVWEVRSSAVTS